MYCFGELDIERSGDYLELSQAGLDICGKPLSSCDDVYKTTVLIVQMHKKETVPMENRLPPYDTFRL
jgi:hypothetical protein